MKQHCAIADLKSANWTVGLYHAGMRAVLRCLVFIWIFTAHVTTAGAEELSRQYSIVGIHYPPFIGFGNSGQAEGLFVDAAQKLFASQSNVSKSIKVLPPRRSQQSVMKDKNLILLSSRAYFSDTEKKELIFVEVLPLEVALFGHKKKIQQLRDLNTLSGRKITVLAGENFQENFVNQRQGIKVEVESVLQMVKMIQGGRADFGFCIPAACERALADANLSSTEFDFKTHVVLRVPADLVFFKDEANQKFAKRIQLLVADLKKQGYLKSTKSNP